MLGAILTVIKDPKVILAFIYLVFPVDFVPDAIPVVGTLDDLVAMLIPMVIQQRQLNNEKRRN